MLFKKRKRKWEELTLEEKVEKMKMDWEYPSILRVWFWLGLVIIFSMVMAIAIDNAYITDIYYQTGLNLSSIGNSTVTKLVTARTDMVNGPLMYFSFAVVALFLFQLGHWVWKWRKFNKTLMVNKK